MQAVAFHFIWVAETTFQGTVTKLGNVTVVFPSKTPTNESKASNYEAKLKLESIHQSERMRVAGRSQI